MIRLVYLIFGIFGCIGTIIAQEVEILSRHDQKPIVGVLICNKDSSKSVITDANGKAFLSIFQIDEIVFIHHIIYQSKSISLASLDTTQNKRKFKIYLQEKAMYLDEIVFSANKSKTNSTELPIRLKTITARQIRLENPQTSADLLTKSGAVFVQKSQAGGGSPVLRGFEANRVLLVIDGIRMNNAIYRGGHLQNVITIDPNIIERVEVIFGSNSVIYGSDALGGVMHFYTKKPEITNKNAELHGGHFFRYSSANQEKSVGADLEYNKGVFAGLTHFTFSNFGDIRTGKTGNQQNINRWYRTHYQTFTGQKDTVHVNPNPLVQIGTAYKQCSVMQKIVYKPHENNQYSLNVQYSTSSKIPRYERLNNYSKNRLKYAEWNYTPQKRLLIAARADFKDLSHFYDHASVILGVQQIEEGRITRKMGKHSRNIRIENVGVYSMNIDLSKKIKAHHLSYGLESYYNEVRSKAYKKSLFGDQRRALPTRYPDGGSEMQNFALYISHRYKIKKPNSKIQFIFSEGLRYSRIRLTSLFKDKVFFPLPFDQVVLNNHALSGSLGGVLKYNRQLDLTLNVSTGFRAPNVDDIGKIFDSEPGLVIVPNTNLKPEYTYNFEIGIRSNIRKKVRFDITGFYTFLDQAIVRSKFKFGGQDSILYDNVKSQVIANTNAKRAIIKGWYAHLAHPLGEHFKIEHQITQTFGSIIPSNEPMAHIPPIYGKSSVIWNYKNWNHELSVQYNGKKHLSKYSSSSSDRLSSATPNGMPAWSVWNYRLTYQYKYFTIQTSIENILDRHYRVFASGLSSMGRNFIISLQSNF